MRTVCLFLLPFICAACTSNGMFISAEMYSAVRQQCLESGFEGGTESFELCKRQTYDLAVARIKQAQPREPYKSGPVVGPGSYGPPSYIPTHPPGRP